MRRQSPMPLPQLPSHSRGMRIGLLGGSFNPPHAAHRMISVMAMKRLGLDRVWWLITPGNPLKDNSALPSTHKRLDLARTVSAHPRIDVLMLEDQIGTRYTIDTLAWLHERCPTIRFVWLLGADSFAGFHRWARRAKAATALAFARQPEYSARRLPYIKSPAWIFFHGRRSFLSSTALRDRTARDARVLADRPAVGSA